MMVALKKMSLDFHLLFFCFFPSLGLNCVLGFVGLVREMRSRRDQRKRSVNQTVVMDDLVEKIVLPSTVVREKKKSQLFSRNYVRKCNAKILRLMILLYNYLSCYKSPYIKFLYIFKIKNIQKHVI
jgi:hypothetical protein